MNEEITEEVILRRRIAEQHDQLIRLEEVHHTAILGALQMLNKTIAQATKVPVAMGIMGFTSWLLFMGHLDQRTWAFCFATAVFPWFGDSIRTIMDIVRGRANGRDAAVLAGKIGIVSAWILEVARV